MPKRKTIDDTTLDLQQVLFNDGINKSDKIYRYETFSFEHIPDFCIVRVETRMEWRSFGEELGNCLGASKALFRPQFSKLNYVMRTAMFLGDLLGHLSDTEVAKISSAFQTMLSPTQIQKGVQTKIISNAMIREICLGLLVVKKSCNKKLYDNWLSHNSAEYSINNLISIATILIESLVYRNVKIKHTEDECQYGLFAACSLKRSQNISVSSSPILYTTYSKTFVCIKPERGAPFEMGERERQKSECIAPLRKGRKSGNDHLNNGMGIAGTNYYVNSSDHPNCLLTHYECFTGIITKNILGEYEISDKKQKMVVSNLVVLELTKKDTQLFWSYSY